MKVKIVLSLLISLLLLASCGGNNENKTESGIGSAEQKVQNKGENLDTSSTIGGGQGTPTEASGFRN